MLRASTTQQADFDVEALLQRVRGAGRDIIRIGRHPGNEVYLDSEDAPLLLSRHHAVMSVNRAVEWEVVDLNSTNGTYVRCLRGALSPWSMRLGPPLGLPRSAEMPAI